MGRRHDKFRKMFYFLEEKQTRAQTFTLEELAEHTGYKMSSIRTYYGKRLKGLLVTAVDDDTYQAQGTEAFDEESFIDYLTQRSSPLDAQEVIQSGGADPQAGGTGAGEPLDSAGAVVNVVRRVASVEERFEQELLHRSEATFKQALMSYHNEARAGLGLCVSGLVQAWELMLKAELYKIRGIKSMEGSAEVEIKALLPKFFPSPRDPVRCNVEWLVELRDRHIALLIGELTPFFSRLLQANVLSFRRRWEAVSERVLFIRGGGVMALGVEGRAPDFEVLKRQYGEDLVRHMERVLERLSRDEIELRGHTSFLASPSHRLVLSPIIDANQVALSDHHATLEAAELMRYQAHEVWRKTHPFSASEVVHEINRRLPYDLRLTAAAIEVIDVAHDVRSAPRSPFYMKLEDSPFHVYSQAYVDWVVNAIKERSDWIKRAQETARRLEE